MIEYLLDTNVLSELMRARPNQGVEAKLTANRRACGVPAPVIDELQFVVCRTSDTERRLTYQEWLEALMTNFQIIPLDGLCAQWHGRERARLTSIGKTPSLYDGLIASIAVVNELILVTHNTADFKGFSGIALQDWHKV